MERNGIVSFMHGQIGFGKFLMGQNFRFKKAIFGPVFHASFSIELS